MTEQRKFRAQHSVQMRFVGRIQRNEALAFLLIELLLFQHPDFVVGRFPSPNTQCKYRTPAGKSPQHGMAAEDAETFIVAVRYAMNREPIRDQAFAVGLNNRAGEGRNRFVELDFRVEITPLEEDFVKAGVAERALEGLLGSIVLLDGNITTTPGATLARAFLLQSNGFSDCFRSGVGGAARVILHPLIKRQVVQIMQALSRGAAVEFEGLERVLLCLRMRIAQGGRNERLHSQARIRAKRGKFANPGRGQPFGSRPTA